MHENMRSLGKNYDKFNSFLSELSRAAAVIVLPETFFLASNPRARFLFLEEKPVLCHG